MFLRKIKIKLARIFILYLFFCLFMLFLFSAVMKLLKYLKNLNKQIKNQNKLQNSNKIEELMTWLPTEESNK